MKGIKLKVQTKPKENNNNINNKKAKIKYLNCVLVYTNPTPYHFNTSPTQLKSDNRTDIQGLNGQITMGGVHVQSSSSSPSSSRSLFLFCPRSSSVNTTQEDQKFCLLSPCLSAFNSQVVTLTALTVILSLIYSLTKVFLIIYLAVI